jgi:hypothetical protein
VDEKMTSWNGPKPAATKPGPILLVGPDDAIQRAIANELHSLPADTITASDLDAAARCRFPSEAPPRVVLLPAQTIETKTFEEQLAGLRIRIGSPRLVPIAFGSEPDDERREALRRAGVDLALFGRFGRHALRFQVNRALSPWVRRRPRGELRAPQEWRTRTFSCGRAKAVRCYSLSSAGAYFVTPRPWIVGSDVQLELPLGRHRQVVEGRILYTNILGPGHERALPRGMAVSFRPLSGELQRLIRAGVTRSQAKLEV